MSLGHGNTTKAGDLADDSMFWMVIAITVCYGFGSMATGGACYYSYPTGMCKPLSRNVVWNLACEGPKNVQGVICKTDHALYTKEEEETTLS
jgi:hypothetical protein